MSSNMPSIQQMLSLTYTGEGMIAASPDFGLVPSGLIAIFFFRYCRAASILNTAYFGIAIVCLVCWLYPGYLALVLARALGGLLWGFAAVHYPAWINTKAPQGKRTILLAVYQSMLLVGIMSGYILGGLTANWVLLYGIEALSMFVCGACAFFFDGDLVQVKKINDDAVDSVEESQPLVSENEGALPPHCSGITSQMPQELVALLTSRIYMLNLIGGAITVGTVGFVLYFIMQVTESFLVDIAPDAGLRTMIIGIVFICGPLGGTLAGGAYLNSMGGYGNFNQAFRVMSGCGFATMISIGLVSVAASYNFEVMFTLAVASFLFIGSFPTAAVVGVAMSAVPGTAHYASGIQFFSANIARLIIPWLGGFVIDVTGLIAGFSTVLMACTVIYTCVVLLGYREVCYDEERTSLKLPLK